MVLYRNGCSRICRNWDEEVQAAIRENSGNGFEAKIRNLAFAASVYHIWMERNCRIFKNARHAWDYVLDRVNESIKDASWNWRASRNYRNWASCNHWGLYDPIILV